MRQYTLLLESYYIESKKEDPIVEYLTQLYSNFLQRFQSANEVQKQNLKYLMKEMNDDSAMKIALSQVTSDSVKIKRDKEEFISQVYKKPSFIKKIMNSLMNKRDVVDEIMSDMLEDLTKIVNLNNKEIVKLKLQIQRSITNPQDTLIQLPEISKEDTYSGDYKNMLKDSSNVESKMDLIKIAFKIIGSVFLGAGLYLFFKDKFTTIEKIKKLSSENIFLKNITYGFVVLVGICFLYYGFSS